MPSTASAALRRRLLTRLLVLQHRNEIDDGGDAPPDCPLRRSLFGASKHITPDWHLPIAVRGYYVPSVDVCCDGFRGKHAAVALSERAQIRHCDAHARCNGAGSFAVIAVTGGATIEVQAGARIVGRQGRDLECECDPERNCFHFGQSCVVRQCHSIFDKARRSWRYGNVPSSACRTYYCGLSPLCSASRMRVMLNRILVLADGDDPRQPSLRRAVECVAEGGEIEILAVVYEPMLEGYLGNKAIYEPLRR